MANRKSFWGSVGLLTATTIGAGMFSLPYVFQKSGWLLGIFYMAVLGAAVIFVHWLYWLALARVDERKRLLGLVRERLGKFAYYSAIISVVGGLFLILVVYLILAEIFGKLILPSPLENFGAVLFWIAATFPLFFNLPRVIGAELWGAVLMVLIILFVFLTGNSGLSAAPTINIQNFLFPFGAVLFSLTAWTAIEPMFEWDKKNGGALSKLALGTIISAAAYLLFTFGILGSAGAISEDTLSGLSSWPSWKIQLLGWLGIFAIWTSHVPISMELRNELEKDLDLPPSFSFWIVVFLPLLLLFTGIFSFLGAISLAGGFFLALQYVFIILVSKKILALSATKKFFANMLILVFLAAAVYETWYFVIN